MIDLESHSAGTILPVRAQPGAKRAGLTGAHAGMLKVAVTQAAEKGKANQALIAALSKVLEVPKSSLELLSGQTSRSKRFLVRGVAIDVLAARLEKLLSEL